jgi:hypothetical protein
MSRPLLRNFLHPPVTSPLFGPNIPLRAILKHPYSVSYGLVFVALGSTQPLTEMSTRNLPGGKGRPAREADNLTAICKEIF